MITALAITGCMQLLGLPLITNAAPGAIVSFELAGDLSTALAIMQSWDQAAMVAAGISLGLDYLYLVIYASTIALGCVLIGNANGSHSLIAVATILAWMQPVAALLDAIENYALIQLLLGAHAIYWPPVAKWCAIPKFIIIAVGLVFLVVGVLMLHIKRLRGEG